MKKIAIISVLLSLLACAGCAQSEQKARQVGGPCEGCEAVFEYGKKQLDWQDTLPDFQGEGPKLEITGTIFKGDGKTPAADVILYIYHTDQSGVYPKRGNEQGWATRHGYIRGWIKTGVDGKYRFLTHRPGAYPGRENPEHIHCIVKEKGLTPYYIDDYLFDDDPILSRHHRQRLVQRGGNGIVKVSEGINGILTVKRDIVLGKNIPGY